MAGGNFTTFAKYKASLDASDYAQGSTVIERSSQKAVSEIDKLLGSVDKTQAAINRAAQQRSRVNRLFDLGLSDGKEETAFNRINEQLTRATVANDNFAGGLGKTVSVLGSLGIAFSGAAVLSFATGVFKATADLNEQAEQIGFSVEALQAYRAALNESGVNAESTDRLLQRLTRSIGQAGEGNKKLIDVFNELHISSVALAAGPSAVLPLVAQALLEIPDAAKRAALETELFSKSGQKLESALHDLATPTAELIARARELGLVIGTDVTTAADKAADAMSRFWTQVKVGTATTVYNVFSDWHTMWLAIGGAINDATDELKKFKDSSPATQAIGQALMPDLTWGQIWQSLRTGRHDQTPTPSLGLNLPEGPLAALTGQGAAPAFNADFAGADSKGIAEAKKNLDVELKRLLQDVIVPDSSLKEGLKQLDSANAFDDKMNADRQQFITKWKPQLTDSGSMTGATADDTQASSARGIGAAISSAAQAFGWHTGGGVQQAQRINDARDTRKEIEKIWDGYDDRQAQKRGELTARITEIEGRGIQDIADLLIEGGHSWRDYAKVAIRAVEDIVLAMSKADGAGGGGSTGGIIGSLLNLGISAFSGGGYMAVNDIGTVAASQIPLTFAGGRAGGGTIKPGTWAMTGENGPEPIAVGWGQPPVHVFPNGGGGGNNTTITIDARGAAAGVEDKIRAVVREEMIPAMSAVHGAAVKTVSDRLRYSGRGTL